MKQLLLFALCLVSVITAQAKYTETMKTKGLEKKMQKDYGLKNDDAQKDQSALFQKAINQLSAKGGGKLIVEKGSYKLANVFLKSNVHILIEKGTVLKPNWPAGEKTGVFSMDVDRAEAKKNPKAFIENVSVRGLNGPFIVDYSDRVRKKGEGCRAINVKMAKNFLIENMDVKDNYSTYCGMCLSPYRGKGNKYTPGIEKWEVSRPTNGTIRNCRIFHASPGYGLVQLHGAQDVHFENLYGEGGVTLRLETGANNGNVGVHNVTGKDIVSEKGRCAIMFGPHSAKNGNVTVEDVLSIGSTYAVKASMAGVKKDAPDQTPGRFEKVYVKNIHAVFGKEAQIKKQGIMALPKAYYDDLKIWPDNKFLDGPSIAATKDDSELYDVTYENITMEGFEYFTDRPITTKEDWRQGNVWKEADEWAAAHKGAKYKTQHAAVVVDYKIPAKTPSYASYTKK